MIEPEMMPASMWAERYYPHKVPDPRTVKSWVKKQLVPGEIRGAHVYINVAAWKFQLANGGPERPAPQRTNCYRV